MSIKTTPATPLNAEELVAHRGFRGKYPENTALSITQAIKSGALFVELDVQFSLDKLPIIYHDTNLARVSGADKDVLSAPGMNYSVTQHMSQTGWGTASYRRKYRR